jgi:hypothetical protein
MRVILASLGLIASFATANAQYGSGPLPYGAPSAPYGGARNTVVPPQTWSYPAPSNSPSNNGYVIVTPGQTPSYVMPLSPTPYQPNPCVYRLGGC